MIPFWIGIFLLEVKGLISLSLSSQLDSVVDVTNVNLSRNVNNENNNESTVIEVFNFDKCDCSWNILSLEFFKGNEYLLTFSQDAPECRNEIVQIEYIYNKTGQRFQILNSHFLDDGLIIIVESLVENDLYTLFMTYRSNCSNCTVVLEFKAPEKMKKNIPVFVGIVAVVSLIIIAMCFYNIRSKCIYRFIQELKRLPFIVNCTDKHFVEFEH
ncbi:unnamed protein product [Psylliodes chrysocephalus]|uniref:Uncharacterized protein n=1 Tax=Psylliodes chrysocephalus TaxID=3402493 RepID=A0A9P0GGK0_9CUCU|nr:unnamed protein product [Psylliodes chrysocephala]